MEYDSLIKQLFRSLVKGVRLGAYWRSIWKRYSYGKLNDAQIRWIVKAKEDGIKSRDIASIQSVSVRRVEQIYTQYKRDGCIPSLKKAGRHRVEITDSERLAVRDAVKRFGVGACYLVGVLKRFYGFKTHHMKIYQVLREEGLLASRARRYVRRKWIRYEREHSNSLWHTDWYEIEASIYRGKYLIVYEDDASRYIVGYDVFDSPSSENAVKVLDEAIRRHGRPASILSDRGSSFYAVEAEAKVRGLTKFELYLMKNHIKQILSGVSHPQTVMTRSLDDIRKILCPALVASI
jgi:putative transposase